MFKKIANFFLGIQTFSTITEKFQIDISFGNQIGKSKWKKSCKFLDWKWKFEKLSRRT